MGHFVFPFCGCLTWLHQSNDSQVAKTCSITLLVAMLFRPYLYFGGEVPCLATSVNVVETGMEWLI